MSPWPMQMWQMNTVSGATPTAGCRSGAALKQLFSTPRVSNPCLPLITWCAQSIACRLGQLPRKFLLPLPFHPSLCIPVFARFVVHRKKLKYYLFADLLSKTLGGKRSWRHLGGVHRVTLSAGSGEVGSCHEMLHLTSMPLGHLCH